MAPGHPGSGTPASARATPVILSPARVRWLEPFAVPVRQYQCGRTRASGRRRPWKGVLQCSASTTGTSLAPPSPSWRACCSRPWCSPSCCCSPRPPPALAGRCRGYAAVSRLARTTRLVVSFQAFARTGVSAAPSCRCQGRRNRIRRARTVTPDASRATSSLCTLPSRFSGTKASRYWLRSSCATLVKVDDSASLFSSSK